MLNKPVQPLPKDSEADENGRKYGNIREQQDGGHGG